MLEAVPAETRDPGGFATDFTSAGRRRIGPQTDAQESLSWFRDAIDQGGSRMDWKQLFFLQHALVHSPEVSTEGQFHCEPMALAGLMDAQIRLRPAENLNSLAWLVWHMTRCEDVAINVAIADRPQVLDDAWITKLGVDRDDIGTGMTPPEVAALSEQIDVDALLSYRHAVGRQTRDVIAAIDDADIEAPVDADRYRRAKVLGEHAGWVDDFWSPWHGTDFLCLATGHCYHHWGEAVTVRSLGGFGLGA